MVQPACPHIHILVYKLATVLHDCVFNVHACVSIIVYIDAAEWLALHGATVHTLWGVG